jgi:hypothetical protein
MRRADYLIDVLLIAVIFPQVRPSFANGAAEDHLHAAPSSPSFAASSRDETWRRVI